MRFLPHSFYLCLSQLSRADLGLTYAGLKALCCFPGLEKVPNSDTDFTAKEVTQHQSLEVCFVQSSSACAFLYSFIFFFCLTTLTFCLWDVWAVLTFCPGGPRGAAKASGSICNEPSGKSSVFWLDQDAEWLCWKCSCVRPGMSLIWKESIQRWCAHSIYFCKHWKPRLLTLDLWSLIHVSWDEYTMPGCRK